MSFESAAFQWGMQDTPLIHGDPFRLARSSCLDAVQVARDVRIDQSKLECFAKELDHAAIRDIMRGSMGENCDVVAGDFHHTEDAVNFALVFSLLQFGHGFRYELHRFCGRGASKTITLGVANLWREGLLHAARFTRISLDEIRHAFQLPDNAELDQFAQQLMTVLHQAGAVLDRLTMNNFAEFGRRVLEAPDARQSPAAALVRELANHFPAFNDQAVLHDGSWVVLVKKAALAVGEIRRLAGDRDALWTMSADFHQAIAPVDNVIPAVLAYHGVLRLSPALHARIHEHRAPLERGHAEAELRAVALIACDWIVAAARAQFTSLDLGYYLWRSGKAPAVRPFPRHHTKDTVFY